jgi:hypothetical protein
VVYRNFARPDADSFSGFSNEGNVNPVSGIGPGYGGSGFRPPPAQSSWSFDPVIYVDPYSFVEAGGIPTTADGVEELLHFTLASPRRSGALDLGDDAASRAWSSPATAEDLRA